MIGAEMALLTAVALFFSTFSSSALLSVVFTVGIFMAGLLSPDLRRFNDIVAGHPADVVRRGDRLGRAGVLGVRRSRPVVHGIAGPGGFALTHWCTRSSTSAAARGRGRRCSRAGSSSERGRARLIARASVAGLALAAGVCTRATRLSGRPSPRRLLYLRSGDAATRCSVVRRAGRRRLLDSHDPALRPRSEAAIASSRPVRAAGAAARPHDDAGSAFHDRVSVRRRSSCPSRRPTARAARSGDRAARKGSAANPERWQYALRHRVRPLLPHRITRAARWFERAAAMPGAPSGSGRSRRRRDRGRRRGPQALLAELPMSPRRRSGGRPRGRLQLDALDAIDELTAWT